MPGPSRIERGVSEGYEIQFIADAKPEDVARIIGGIVTPHHHTRGPIIDVTRWNVQISLAQGGASFDRTSQLYLSIGGEENVVIPIGASCLVLEEGRVTFMDTSTWNPHTGGIITKGVRISNEEGVEIFVQPRGSVAQPLQEAAERTIRVMGLRP